MKIKLLWLCAKVQKLFFWMCHTCLTVLPTSLMTFPVSQAPHHHFSAPPSLPSRSPLFFSSSFSSSPRLSGSPGSMGFWIRVGQCWGCRPEKTRRTAKQKEEQEAEQQWWCSTAAGACWKTPRRRRGFCFRWFPYKRKEEVGGGRADGAAGVKPCVWRKTNVVLITIAAAAAAAASWGWAPVVFNDGGERVQTVWKRQSHTLTMCCRVALINQTGNPYIESGLKWSYFKGLYGSFSLLLPVRCLNMQMMMRVQHKEVHFLTDGWKCDTN